MYTYALLDIINYNVIYKSSENNNTAYLKKILSPQTANSWWYIKNTQSHLWKNFDMSCARYILSNIRHIYINELDAAFTSIVEHLAAELSLPVCCNMVSNF